LADVVHARSRPEAKGFGSKLEESQKVEGLQPEGIAGLDTARALAQAVRPRPRSDSDNLVEVDKQRQVLLVVGNGEVEWVFNTSTGKNRRYESGGVSQVTETPSGRWSVSWEVRRDPRCAAGIALPAQVLPPRRHRRSRLSQRACLPRLPWVCSGDRLRHGLDLDLRRHVHRLDGVGLRLIDPVTQEYPRAMGDGGDRIDLARSLAEVARVLKAEDDVDATLTKLVHLAVETLDACEHAGISLIRSRRVSSGPRTDEVPAIIDDLQNEVDDGPCAEAIRKHETVRTGRLSEEGRWPEFARRAHGETGIQSILSLRLFIEEDTMGALNLYSSLTDAFDEEDIAIGTAFAAHGAVAMASARKEESLQEALDSRVVIEQAKGKLSAERGISIDAAFEVLRDCARSNNVKIRSVAQEVVEDLGRSPQPEPAADH
jgi:putative methionine-R-sulfoxide reductase with GAF domain